MSQFHRRPERPSFFSPEYSLLFPIIEKETVPCIAMTESGAEAAAQ
jgi:hypothetical protein